MPWAASRSMYRLGSASKSKADFTHEVNASNLPNPSFA